MQIDDHQTIFSVTHNSVLSPMNRDSFFEKHFSQNKYSQCLLMTLPCTHMQPKERFYYQIHDSSLYIKLTVYEKYTIMKKSKSHYKKTKKPKLTYRF